jgi:penicillin amidase
MNHDSPRRPRRLLRRLLLALLAVAVPCAVAVGWVYSELRASLPRLDGSVPLTGLRAPVQVRRDADGVPTVEAADRLDVSRALGFLHAQDRFFQMDLSRRRAAGELSELFGAAALSVDRGVRIHRFRAVAQRTLASLAPSDRAHLEAYAAGVRAGLDALGTSPFEYLVLRAEPEPWRPEDSLLVAYAMFLTLHDDEAVADRSLGLMSEVLPRPLFEFLTPEGTGWDAPLVGGAIPPPPLPGPEVVDLRSAPKPEPPDREALPEPASELGSNNWAVAGRLTGHGSALLANDMHLGIRVPNTWYRASLIWTDRIGARHHVTGVTLPGAPALVAGSNGSVAWGFTNSQGDWVDLVEVEVSPDDDDRYLTPQGVLPFERYTERVRVRGAEPEPLVVIGTIWGPILDHDHRGRPRALRWTAHEPEAVNLGLLLMERATDIEDALEIATAMGLAPQNLVCADSTGRVGWTIAGRIPRRVGFDGRLPASWASGELRWDGWLPPASYPRVVDPPTGVIWTANARVVEGEMLERIGFGRYALGARAAQIRDDLLALRAPVTERDMLDVQLDDRARFFQRWRDLLLQVLESRGSAPGDWAELRGLVADWGGRAAIDSVGYRATGTFRHRVAQLAMPPLTAACSELDPGFDYLSAFRQHEGPLWRLVEERPLHLLTPRFESWEALLETAVDETIAALRESGPELRARTWGEANTTRIRHPLSDGLPWLSRWLDMPSEPLPGDSHMPRVQHPASGASERFAVSPGREGEGYFHMPGGQSGHPLSAFYSRGHSAWATGEPTPFLPGPAVHALVLEPPDAGSTTSRGGP